MADVIYTDAHVQVTIVSNDDITVVQSLTPDAQASVIITESASANVISSSEIGPQGVQGAQGIPGPAGATIISYPAASAIGGHRVVVLNADEEVEYADNTTAAHANKVIGLTTGAAIEGADVIIQSYGEMSEVSWSWTLDVPVWLGTNGLMTQTPPTSGFSLIIGFPVSATKLFVDLREPIFLI